MVCLWLVLYFSIANIPLSNTRLVKKKNGHQLRLIIVPILCRVLSMHPKMESSISSAVACFSAIMLRVVDCLRPRLNGWRSFVQDKNNNTSQYRKPLSTTTTTTSNNNKQQQQQQQQHHHPPKSKTTSMSYMSYCPGERLWIRFYWRYI